jgi:hypothetical protein
MSFLTNHLVLLPRSLVDAKNGGSGVDTVPMDEYNEDEFGFNKDREEKNNLPTTLVTSGLLRE